jgi:hypothetical protein
MRQAANQHEGICRGIGVVVNPYAAVPFSPLSTAVSLTLHRIIYGLLALLACGSSAQGFAETSTSSSDVVIVETHDGRRLSGQVDARSDGDQLWLRREQPSIVLVVPTAWSNIASATVAGASVTPLTLKQQYAEFASAGPRALLPQVELPINAVPTRLAPPIRRVRVRNLEIVCATIANFDRDVEPDGIEVTIAAVGDDGLPIAVRGTLRAEMYGERRPLYEPEAEFDELARWTQRVQPEDFVDGLATYQLPFRTTAPEWEFDLLPDAILTVLLGAAGHGNYAASAPVVVRKFNPLRDDLQQYRGLRFLPTELHGARPLNSFGPQYGRWQHWTW